jgi:hypothetical protein
MSEEILKGSEVAPGGTPLVEEAPKKIEQEPEVKSKEPEEDEVDWETLWYTKPKVVVKLFEDKLKEVERRAEERVERRVEETLNKRKQVEEAAKFWQDFQKAHPKLASNSEKRAFMEQVLVRNAGDFKDLDYEGGIKHLGKLGYKALEIDVEEQDEVQYVESSSRTKRVRKEEKSKEVTPSSDEEDYSAIAWKRRRLEKRFGK